MDKNFLKNTMLFRDLSDDEVDFALDALAASEKKYDKGELIFFAGQTTDSMGLVLYGSITIENNDVWGNRTILSHIGKGQFFAETYAYLKDEPMLVDVAANEDCLILFLKTAKLPDLLLNNTTSPRTSSTDKDSRSKKTGAESAWTWAAKLTANLLAVSTQKNLILSGRSFHISPKSVRGRVMSYLNSLHLKSGSYDLTIPFDRQQMADYLNVDRTALSKELSNMQKDGLIEYRKNRFLIKSDDILDV